MENAALALQAYALLELPWQAERLAEALRRTRVTGRLDRRDLSWNGQPRQPCWTSGTIPRPPSTWRNACVPQRHEDATWRSSACWRTRTWMAYWNP